MKCKIKRYLENNNTLKWVITFDTNHIAIQVFFNYDMVM